VEATIATDRVSEGVKSNALLEEETWSTVNQHIGDSNSVREVKEHWRTVLSPIAEKFNITLDPFGMKFLPPASGKETRRTPNRIMRLSDAFGTALDDSPFFLSDYVWEILCGRSPTRGDSGLDS